MGWSSRSAVDETLETRSRRVSNSTDVWSFARTLVRRGILLLLQPARSEGARQLVPQMWAMDTLWSREMEEALMKMQSLLENRWGGVAPSAAE